MECTKQLSVNGDKILEYDAGETQFVTSRRKQMFTLWLKIATSITPWWSFFLWHEDLCRDERHFDVAFNCFFPRRESEDRPTIWNIETRTTQPIQLPTTTKVLYPFFHHFVFYKLYLLHISSTTVRCRHLYLHRELMKLWKVERRESGWWTAIIQFIKILYKGVVKVTSWFIVFLELAFVRSVNDIYS